MSAFNLPLYDILRKELEISDEKARKITIAIQDIVKEDGKEINNEYKSIFKQDFKDFDNKLEREFSKLDVKIEQTKFDMIKWFVGLFIALALMIIGLYLRK